MLLFFVLVVFVFTNREVLYPGNLVSGYALLFLFVKKFCGHFACTVFGCLVLRWLYQRNYWKKTVVLLIGASLGANGILHSLMNQRGLGVFLGALLQGIGVSQVVVVLFVLSLVLLVLFLLYKGREEGMEKRTI